MSESGAMQIETKKIAGLSRISLDDNEASLVASKFSTILSAFETVQAVEVGDVHELQQARTRSDLREDRKHDSLGQDRALENAPQNFNGHFRVPAIL